MSVYKIIIGKDVAPQNKNTSQCKSVRGKKKKIAFTRGHRDNNEKKIKSKISEINFVLLE